MLSNHSDYKSGFKRYICVGGMHGQETIDVKADKFVAGDQHK